MWLDRAVGVMGGMGPWPTLEFVRRVRQTTLAYSDQDHVDLVICDHATLPDRTPALQGGDRAQLVEQLVSDARRLQHFGVGMLVIPCNTAHAFLTEIRAAVCIPVADMIGMACAAARRHVDRGGTVGVLATSGTITAGLYQTALAEVDRYAAVPGTAGQELVMDTIYAGVKRGAPPTGRAQSGCGGVGRIGLLVRNSRLHGAVVPI